ncbi:MAG: helix-turn-helix domain-containing protein [Pseudonocardiales bacterium]
MSDEQADEISERASDTPLVDPALFKREDVRRILAALDIAALYRVLGDDAGISQRQIAACTGQSQSEVSDIVAGRRRVESHQVLMRIADGFDIPRELMGLSWWGPDGTYAGKVTVTESPTRESEEMRRRTLIARHYAQWLDVPASDAVKARLGCALAELYTEAGWSCYDAGVDGTGYFTRALRTADEFGDAFGIANAACHAGVTLVRSGYPDEALKCFQLGGFPLTGFQPGKAKPAILRDDDSRGLLLARRAIDAASTLQSVAARRQRLVPLAIALEARPGSDVKELARTARQLATTRV